MLLVGFCLLWIILAGYGRIGDWPRPNGGRIPGIWGRGGVSLDIYEWRILLTAFWLSLVCAGTCVVLLCGCALIPWPSKAWFHWG